MGPHRQGRGDGQGQGDRRRRRPARPRAGAAGAAPGPDQRGHARRRRRDRRHLGRARDRRRRLPGPPRRAPAVDRRPHGPVRQDVPDARLRGLHPDPEDGDGGLPPEHHAAHLERGDRRVGLRRQLHGQGPPPAALRRHRPVHRLRHLRGEVPGQGRRPGVRGRDRLPQGDLPAVPAGGPQVPRPRPRQLHLLRERHVQGLREALPAGGDPPRPAARGGDPPGRQHRPGHRLRAVRCATRRAVRLRPAGERLHQPRVRADEQRQRTDRRPDRAARRGHRARRAWRSSTASAAGTATSTTTARRSAACRA